MKNMKKIISSMLAMLVMIGCLFVPATPAFAAEDVGSITVNFEETEVMSGGKYTTQYIDGATFAVALVALEGNGKFEWIDVLEKNEMFTHDIEELYNEDSFNKLAEILVTNYTDGLDVTKNTTTKDGKCYFGGLERGIYLVWQTAKQGLAKEYFTSAPFLIEIPDRSGDDWDFDVDAYPKAVRIPEVIISGTKHWVGRDIVGKSSDETEASKSTVATDGTTEQETVVYRPDSITLRLYANGKEVEKVTVTAENNWEYTFSKRDRYDDDGEEISFKIREDTVKGYTFSQSSPKEGKESGTLIINVTNTVGEPSSKTGDETNMALWIILVIACVILAAVVMFVPSKKKKKEEAVNEQTNEADAGEVEPEQVEEIKVTEEVAEVEEPTEAEDEEKKED